MENNWRRLGYELGRRWALVAIAFVVITAVLALGARNLEFATGQDSYLNEDSQIAIDNELLQDEFGGETIILLFQAQGDADITDLFAGANLAELERLESELREIEQVYSVVAPLTTLKFSESITTGLTPAGETLAPSPGTGALLSALEREQDPEGKAAREADIGISLARLGAVTERDLANPDWVEFLTFGNQNVELVDGAPQLPAGEDRAVRASLQGVFPNLQTAVGGVLLTGNADLDSLSAGTQAVLDIAETAQLEGFDVTVTGSPVFLKDINDYLQGGMLTLGAIALALMAVILAVMFRVRWRFLPLLSTVVGVMWGFALLGYIGIDLSLVTISGLPILIGLGIDFAIQIHNRIEEEAALDKDAHPISETLANVGPALVAATLSAVVAFMALQISQVPMIRDFGVMLAVGIVALVFCGIVLPATILGVREYKSRTATKDESVVERIVVRLGGLPLRTAVPMVVLSVILFVAGVALEGQFETESDPVKWINQDTQTVRDLENLEESTGFSSTLSVLVTANNVLDEDVARVLHDFTTYAESLDEVATSSSLTGTMAKIIGVEGASPLPPTSADVVAAAAVMPDDIRKVLLADGDTATQVNLRLAPASLADRAELVAQLEADLDRRIAELDLPADSVLLQGLDADQPVMRAVPAGLAVVGVGLLENLSANRAILTYLGLALSGLYILIRFQSAGRAALTLVPVGLAIGTSSVIVALFDLTLSPLTTVSGPLVIASCTEFSVLITARYLEERQAGRSPTEASDHAARRTGQAFFTSAATTVGGFAVLIGSALPLLRDFGIIVSMNVAVALLAALIVMPPLLMWADERGIFPVEQSQPGGAVQLAAQPRGRRLVAWVVTVLAVAAVAVGLWASAERDSGDAVDVVYTPTPLPTTTTTAPAEGS